MNFLARNGIWIKTESGSKTVYFIFGLILGDNKGLNEVLGFAGSFLLTCIVDFARGRELIARMTARNSLITL